MLKLCLRTSSHLSRTCKWISCNHPLRSTLRDTTGDTWCMWSLFSAFVCVDQLFAIRTLIVKIVILVNFDDGLFEVIVRVWCIWECYFPLPLSGGPISCDMLSLRGWFCFTLASFSRCPLFSCPRSLSFPHLQSMCSCKENLLTGLRHNIEMAGFFQKYSGPFLLISGMELISEGIASFDEVSSEFGILTLETAGLCR